MTSRFVRSVAVVASLLLPALATAQSPQVFQTPEEAVTALRTAARAKDIEPLLTLLGPGSRDLAASSDPASARQNRRVFLVAMREGWKLADVSATRKELVVGHEEWPFPVPLVKTAKGWMFDAAAGKEEVLTRRIGRNELAAMHIVQTYVAAQRAYARREHDAIPAGAYARRLASTAGKEDGLYWAVKPGQSSSSPLGPLVADAAAEGVTLGAGSEPTPFHGYYFRILEKQGAAAPGGAKSYVVGSAMTGGFALVAWPSGYGTTGVMTFIVGPDGVTYERDLGANTPTAVKSIQAFNPDKTWRKVVATAPK